MLPIILYVDGFDENSQTGISEAFITAVLPKRDEMIWLKKQLKSA